MKDAAIATTARDAIFKDLHVLYSRQFESGEIAVRFGRLLSIVTEIVVRRLRSESS